MYRIIDKRSSGKTSRLMLLAKENNGIIVCRNPKAMEEKAKRYGIVGIDFITYGEYMQLDPYTYNSKPYYIDELEVFIRSITPGTVDGYTISEE